MGIALTNRSQNGRSTQVPVEELVSGMVSHLPLKEDLEEYELVFKAFLTLYSAGHSVTPQCIPKIVESAAHFTTAHSLDKTKVGDSFSPLSVIPNRN